MTDFFSMGGYGAFIWPCYGLAVIFVAALYIHSQRKLRRTQAQAELLKN